MANYVNNKDFYYALIKYQDDLKTANHLGLPPPKIPEYIGECLDKIAQRLATKPNFSGYSFVDEMIGDSLENCFRYLHVFNPAFSQNPFAFFTQTIKMAFIRRIKNEKKQTYIKMKETQNFSLTAELNSTKIPIDMESVDEFIQDYELGIQKKKLKKGLEKIFANVIANTVANTSTGL